MLALAWWVALDEQAVGQSNDPSGDDMRFVEYVHLWKGNCATTPAAGTVPPMNSALLYARFRVVDTGDNFVKIRFLPWVGNTVRTTTYAETPAGLPVYHCVSRTEYSDYARRAPASTSRVFSAAVVIPYKLRPGWGRAQFEFASDVGIAAGLGLSWERWLDVHLGGIIALGPTLIELEVEGDTVSRGAFTVAAGLTMDVYRVQLALVAGIDLVSSRGGLDWPHHGHPWFGVAIGANLFRAEAESKSQ